MALVCEAESEAQLSIVVSVQRLALDTFDIRFWMLAEKVCDFVCDKGEQRFVAGVDLEGAGDDMLGLDQGVRRVPV